MLTHGLSCTTDPCYVSRRLDPPLRAISQTPCNDGTDGWGRKKRDITLDNSVGEISAYADKKELGYHMIKERQADASGPFDIDVGGKVKIVEKYSDIRKYRIFWISEYTFRSDKGR